MTVQASNSAGKDDQTINVTVTNAVDTPDLTTTISRSRPCGGDCQQSTGDGDE
ncbi:MAG: hypothetical protein R2932_16630 [Caldilineaceae bacterium]